MNMDSCQDEGSIFNLCNIKYLSDEEPYPFYIKFRSFIYNHLKLKGDSSSSGHYEILSSTFEEIIILWCLEKIDSDLPAKLSKIFSKKLINHNITVRDIHQEIFKYIKIIDCKHDKTERSSSEIFKDDDSTKQGYLDIKEEDLYEIFEGSEYDNMNNEIMKQDDNTVFTVHNKKMFGKKLTDSENEHACKICIKSFRFKNSLTKHMRLKHGTVFSRGRKPRIPRSTPAPVFLDHNTTGKDMIESVKEGKNINHSTVEISESDCHDVIEEVSDESDEFLCPACNKMFSFKRNLRRHLRTDHECSATHIEQVFKTLTSLKLKAFVEETGLPSFHTKKHHRDGDEEKSDEGRGGGKHVVCPDCGISLTKHYLLQHIKRKHSKKEQALKCDKCDKAYPCMEYLKNHIARFHSQDKNVVCPDCGITVNKDSFRRHSLIHKTAGNFQCDICNKLLPSKYSLHRHRKKHEHNPNFGKQKNQKIESVKPILTINSIFDPDKINSIQ